jgi:lysophospholipase L1-like esterase
MNLFSFRDCRRSGWAILLVCAGLLAGLRAQSEPAPAWPMPHPLNPALPMIFIAGDSTAAPGNGGITGWGVPFPAYFDPAKVNLVNGARGGRSSRTFINDGSWDRIVARLKAGDIVLIQFGHNDGGAINEEPPGSNRPLRARGSLPGLGEETQAIDNVVTKQHEVVHTYGWYVRKMISDTRARGATPILLSLTVRNYWNDGRIERGNGRYSAWAAELARAEKVPFIDLTNLVADELDLLGESETARLYQPDRTHTNKDGADFHACFVVAGLKGLRPSPVKQFLSAQGEAVTVPPGFGLNLPRPADPSLPSLFLIGDSTVRNGRGDGAGGQWGWGDFLGAHFDAAKINVVNRAVGGLSSRTFLTQGHWERVRAMLKPGDFVIMQFGHNDNGSLNDTSRARGTIKGIGDETEAIDNLLTKQHEIVHSYGWYLRKFVADTRAKGATPIICSLVPRKIWKDGKIARNKQDYAGWAEKVASAERVPFLDLNERIAQRYDTLGEEKVNALFADEHTHTSADGAKLNATVVVEALRALPENPLASFLRATPEPRADNVPAAMPQHSKPKRAD